MSEATNGTVSMASGLLRYADDAYPTIWVVLVKNHTPHHDLREVWYDESDARKRFDYHRQVCSGVRGQHVVLCKYKLEMSEAR